MLKIRLLARPSNIFFLLLILAIIFNPFVIVNAGERGVLMVFGQVQDHILNEGIHGIIPVVNREQETRLRPQDLRGIS